MMKTLSGYFWWTYERGSLHYDVMVTAILLFIFVGPRFIDFKDKPAPPVSLRGHEVLVKSARTVTGGTQFIYEVRAEDIAPASTDEARRAALLRVIEPISGDVTLQNYQPVIDTKGKIAAYDATVLR